MTFGAYRLKFAASVIFRAYGADYCCFNTGYSYPIGTGFDVRLKKGKCHPCTGTEALQAVRHIGVVEV
jgi:hypothetical protein